MFDLFGIMDSAVDINDLASNLRREKDYPSIKTLAYENGIDMDIADAFIDGDILFLCDPMSAALGKIEIEAADMKASEIMSDWVEYLKSRCFEDENIAKAVRRKSKSLKGCIGAILAWSFKHQIDIDKEILKAAGVNDSKVTLGIPGIGMAKKIITEYYLQK